MWAISNNQSSVSVLPSSGAKSELDQLGLNYIIGKNVWSYAASVAGNLVSVSCR